MLTARGPLTAYVLIFIHLGSRRVYDRAVLYHETGQRARARSEFERIYAADPGFEDVAERLGVGG